MSNSASNQISYDEKSNLIESNKEYAKKVNQITADILVDIIIKSLFLISDGNIQVNNLFIENVTSDHITSYLSIYLYMYIYSYIVSK